VVSRVFRQILGISLLGGLVNLDDVPIIQVMISQPIVAAPLISWMWGDLRFGLVIGAFWELLTVCFLPIGNSIPLDGSLATITATGICILTSSFFPGSTEALIALAILLSLPFSILAQKASVFIRRLNGKISDRAQRAVITGNLKKINALHMSGIGLFYLRSFGLCFFSLLLVVPLLKIAAPSFTSGIFRGLELLYLVYPILGIASAFDHFRNRSMYGFFTLSFLSAILLSVVWSVPNWIAFGLPCLVWGVVYGAREILG
jgi:PTS system mannose-specific IIC component